MGVANRLIPINRTRLRFNLRAWLQLGILALLSRSAAAQDIVLQLDPSQSNIKFTLGAALHTVHGSFHLNKGSLRANPASGTLSGEIVVDATSGESGNGSRDRKMHKEVLESARYPQISFRPDHIDGAVAPRGKSSVKVHGVISLHGSDHEITIPAEVDISPDHWTANSHFTIPYMKWGMKNPSTFFLHVSDEVEIDVAAAGSLASTTSQ